MNCAFPFIQKNREFIVAFTAYCVEEGIRSPTGKDVERFVEECQKLQGELWAD